MIKALKTNFTYKNIFGSFVWAMILSVVFLLCIHLFQYLSPTSRWFDYKSVIPTKAAYQQWDKITFRSTVNRKRSINMQWQDLVYCKDYEDEYWHKMPTQYRPDQGMEYITPWYRSSIREYSIKIPDNMYMCKMCGNSIWTTSRWYTKVYNYCTDTFYVNL